jgi:RNA polymerase sigma factor (sigma-70 family)
VEVARSEDGVRGKPRGCSCQGKSKPDARERRTGQRWIGLLDDYPIIDQRARRPVFITAKDAHVSAGPGPLVRQADCHPFGPTAGKILQHDQDAPRRARRSAGFRARRARLSQEVVVHRVAGHRRETLPLLQTRITLRSDCGIYLFCPVGSWAARRLVCIVGQSDSSLLNIVALSGDGYARRPMERSDIDMTPSGLSAVLLANRGALLRFLRARGAGDDAEDVMQDLWLKVDRLEAEGPIADPRAYLFRMADNLMHDRVRAAMRRTNREHAWGGTGNDNGELDDTPSAERALAARQRLRRVELALATLGERSQAIFRRFRIDGVTQVRIAQEEGISVSAVEKHLQRAYRIVATLADEDDDNALPSERAR